MPIFSIPRLLFTTLLFLLVGCGANVGNQKPVLSYLGQYDIEIKKVGLRQPSGIVFSPQQDSLWVVSDDMNRVFKLTREGVLLADDTIMLSDKGLEGLTIEPTGTYLFMVEEAKNEILKIDISSDTIAKRRRLSEMDGHDAVAAYLASGGKNKGLEGITWNSDSDTIFVMKEGEPGLLIELSPDLERILNHRLLGQQNGFHDDDVDEKELDYSGITYDPTRACFWIISDKARRLFLYDWTSNQVIETFPLNYPLDGETHEIVKAEGVTLDLNNNRLYLVSDKEARLYLFEIGDSKHNRCN
ncbi:MAG: SdiA-regulated domain-containing protein [Ardenticatenaceae bacterium]